MGSLRDHARIPVPSYKLRTTTFATAGALLVVAKSLTMVVRSRSTMSAAAKRTWKEL